MFVTENVSMIWNATLGRRRHDPHILGRSQNIILDVWNSTCRIFEKTWPLAQQRKPYLASEPKRYGCLHTRISTPLPLAYHGFCDTHDTILLTFRQHHLTHDRQNAPREFLIALNVYRPCSRLCFCLSLIHI